MRQCVACQTTYPIDQPTCPRCGGTRSFRLAAPAPGAVDHARRLRGLFAGFGGPDWEPNGVRWAGIGMIALELPVALLLPTADGMAYLNAIPYAILVAGILITFGWLGDWGEWLGRIFCAFELLRVARELWYSTILEGVSAVTFAALGIGVILTCILVLLSHGYSHPKSPRWIRIMLPLLGLNLLLCGIAFFSDMGGDGPEEEAMTDPLPALPGFDPGPAPAPADPADEGESAD